MVDGHLRRDVDTGMAKWVYQMTPHDEWDFDGVNEMILARPEIGGAAAQDPRAFRPQRLRLAARPRHRRIAGGREIRPVSQLGDQGRHGQDLQDYGRPLVVPKFSTDQNGEDVNSKAICRRRSN